MIYLDNAATTLHKPPEVRWAVRHAMLHCASPGRGGHAPAQEAERTVYAARETAAELFACAPEQVCFTLNATHALNIALHSLVRPGSQVVTSGFEHNAVVRPLHALHAEVTVAGRRLFDPEDTLRAFEEAVTPQTAAVVCTQVSNVFGYILPIDAIATLCHSRGVPLIVDASQAAGCLPVDQSRWNAAFIAMPGHKGLYGPQGTGILIAGAEAEPLLYGGTGSLSQSPEMPEFLPDRLEAGTLNVAGIAGLDAGMRYVLRRGTEQILREEQRCAGIIAAGIGALPGVRCFTGTPQTQTGVVSFCMQDYDCELLASALAQEGVAVRAGLHCAPQAHQSAGTLHSGTVRVSVGAHTTRREAEKFVNILKTLSQRRRDLTNLLAL